MRFVLAIISFVIGVVLVGIGVGQRTVFAPPTSTVASTSTSTRAPVTVIPGSTLVANPGHQRVEVSGGSGATFAAYGKTSDVNAWVGDARHRTLRYDADATSLRSHVSGTARTVPNPKGSDLWYGEYQGTNGKLAFTVDLPKDTSLIVVSNGTTAAPSAVSITWPRDTSTPLVGPLLTGGAFFLALGIALYIWALLHQRRLRGPRRRSGGTRPPRARGSRRRAAAAGAQVPPRNRRGRRMVAVLPVVAIASLALAGCSSEYWPSGPAASPTPSASGTAAAAASAPTAATMSQIRRILARVSAVADAADASRDADQAAERFTGAALDLRKANYQIRGSDTDVQAPPAIPSSGISVALPQQTDAWPRSVFLVAKDPGNADAAPQALTLVQASPRAQYKVQSDVSLEAGAKFNGIPPVQIGAAQLSPDVKLLELAPGQVAQAYSDILANDTASRYNDLFSADGDDLRSKIGKSYKDNKASQLPSTAKIEYSSEVPEDSSIALATNAGGALVAADLDEIETVTPTADGAEVNTEGAVKALSGVDKSTKGITATYGVQLLFYVPPVGSKAKIELLGFSQGLIAASEVQ